jgi:tellurite resistance protein
MSNGPKGESIDQRERELAEAFFHGDAEALRAHLELRGEESAARESLAAATGINDPTVVAELAGLGIRVDTLAALTLIPLIHVAWADGEMDQRERQAILDAAEATGSEKGSTSYRLLEIWTLEEPPMDLTNAWQAFIGALSTQLSSDEGERLRANLLGRAREVAAAAGSRLDRSPHVSAEEDACLQSLARAFSGQSR